MITPGQRPERVQNVTRASGRSVGPVSERGLRSRDVCLRPTRSGLATARLLGARVGPKCISTEACDAFYTTVDDFVKNVGVGLPSRPAHAAIDGARLDFRRAKLE